jgi:hypothetical protein
MFDVIAWHVLLTLVEWLDMHDSYYPTTEKEIFV